MGDTVLPDREVEDAITAAAVRLREEWDVDVPLRRVSPDADRASAPDDLLFMAMGGRGRTHVTYGAHRDLPREPGINRWETASVSHVNLEASAMRFVRKVMGPEARSRMIERALKAAGLAPDAKPGWAYIVHPLARRLVETSDIDLERLDGNAGHLFSRGLVGIWTRREKWKKTIYAHIGEAGDRYEERSTSRTIALRSATLPDSLLSAINRMPLDQVIEHPRLAGTEAVVNSARNDGGTTILTVAAAWTTLRPPPRGIDTPWLGTLT